MQVVPCLSGTDTDTVKERMRGDSWLAKVRNYHQRKLKWSHTNPSTLFFVTGWLGEGGHEGDPGDSWARHHPQSSGQCQPLGPVHLESADKISGGRGPWWLHVSIKYGSNEESSKFSLTVLGIYLILGNLRKLLFFLCNSRWATWT